MGRNTVGGKKGKSMANKATNNRTKIRLSEDPLELYACVTKCNGSGLFSVCTNAGETFVAHVRGKMKGPAKRSNFVSLYSLVLVGLRDWEGTKKNCDIIYIYNPQDIQLLSQLPNIQITKLLSIHNNNGLDNGVANGNDGIYMDDNAVAQDGASSSHPSVLVTSAEEEEVDAFDFDAI